MANPTLADESMHSSWKVTNLRESVWKELCHKIMKIALQEKDSSHYNLAHKFISMPQAMKNPGRQKLRWTKNAGK